MTSSFDLKLSSSEIDKLIVKTMYQYDTEVKYAKSQLKNTSGSKISAIVFSIFFVIFAIVGGVYFNINSEKPNIKIITLLVILCVCSLLATLISVIVLVSSYDKNVPINKKIANLKIFKDDRIAYYQHLPNYTKK